MKRLVLAIPCSWPQMPREFVMGLLKMTDFSIQKELLEREIEVKYLINSSFPLDRNRHEIVDLALNRWKADWILWLDVDNIHPRNTILSLLNAITDEYPVCSGIYWKRHSPHTPVVGRYNPWSREIEKHRSALMKIGMATEERQFLFHTPVFALPARPFEIDVSGMGCLLTHRSAFETIGLPYFKYFSHFEFPEQDFDETSEEMLLFAKWKQAGVKVRAHPDVLVGHLTEKEVTIMDQEIPYAQPSAVTAPS